MPKRRPRRRFQFERLEDRILMIGNSGDGPEFVHNPPPPPPPGDPPIVVQATLTATNDYFHVRTDAVNSALHVLTNDHSPSGLGSMKITFVSATKLGGLVSIAPDGRSLIYTPASRLAAYDQRYGGLLAGTDSFYYDVLDTAGRVSRADVSVEIFTPLRGPQSDWFTSLEDEPSVELDVLANDQEFASGTIVGVEQPATGGTVSIAEDDKKLVFVPATGFTGYVSFQYTVQHVNGHTATASAAVSVRPRFEARNDQFEVDVDSRPIELDVLANDIRRQNPEPPRIVDVELPGGFAGTLSIAADGSKVIFEPAEGFIGHLCFRYTVRYGPAEHHVSSASATIRVIDPFLAVDNWYMVDPGSANNILDVQANDPELRGYRSSPSARVVRTITAVSVGSAGGHVEIDERGDKIQYTPATGFTGDETFTYTVVDESGHMDMARVTVHVAVEEADPFNLPRFRHPGELVQFLIDEAVEQYALQFGQQMRTFVPKDTGGGGVTGEGDLDGPVTIRLYANSTVLAGDYSSTNVQHLGIDEADVVETDGKYIYFLSEGRLTIVDVREIAIPKLVSVTQFDDAVTEMYLQGDRLTLIARGSSSSSYGYHDIWLEDSQSVAVHRKPAAVIVLDVSDRNEPRLVERTVIDGNIIDTRAIGDRVHVVTQRWINYPPPRSRVVGEIPAEDGSGTWHVTAIETLDEYIARVGEMLAEVLPQFRTFDAAGELVASGPLSDVGQIHKPISKEDRVLASLVTFDVSDATDGPITSTGLFTNASDKLYVSHAAVYLIRTNAPGPWDYSDSTRILKFEFRDDGTTSLEAAGTVAGRIHNQFSLDERDGLLRIVTNERMINTVGRELRQWSQLFVLEHVGTDLRVVGSVQKLAPTENVKSVRFVDDRAYVVTFRVVDPLFVIDLSEPTAPRVAGALKIPGYSDYLHPVGEDYLIGFGRDADEITGRLGAAQVSLFYVGDFDNPTLVDRMTLDGADWITSEAFVDHHAIAYFEEHQVLSIPIGWRNVSRNIGVGMEYRTNRSAAFVFQFDLDGATGNMEFAGRIEHEAAVRRTVRIGDTLLTVSEQALKVHSIDEPETQLGEVYLGNLPRDDTFTVQEDSGPTSLDVLSNDRPNESGQPPSIVAVTQPVQNLYGYPINYGLDGFGVGKSGRSAGTVEIAADGRSVIFTPAENFFGAATFTYTVFDPIRGAQTATVTVQVQNVPDAPDAVDDQFDVALGASGVVLDVLANDINHDAGAYPNLWLDNDAVVPIARTPALQLEVVSASFAAEPSVGLIAPAAELIDLSPAYPVDPRFSFPGSSLKIIAVGSTDRGGTVEIDEHGGFLRYTPAGDFEGVETFTYTIQTSHGLTDIAKVSVRVGAPMTLVLAAEPDTPEPIDEMLVTGMPTTETPMAEPAKLAVPDSTAVPIAAFGIDVMPSAASATMSRSYRSAIGSRPILAITRNDLVQLALAAGEFARASADTSEHATFTDLPDDSDETPLFGTRLADDLVAELAASLVSLG